MVATATKKASPTHGIESGALRRALLSVSHAVGGKSTSEAMQGVLLSPNRMSCTDGEIRIDVAFDCGVECVVPHSRLLAIASACPHDERVSFSLNGSSCVIKSGKGKWALPTIDVGEFPRWDVGKTAAGLSLPCDQLEHALTSVLVSADKGSGAMSSVVVEITESDGVFAAMDGRSIALARVEHDLAVDRCAIVLPARAAQAIAKLAHFAGGEAEARFRHAANAVVVSLGDAAVTCRQLATQPPDYKKINSEIAGCVTVVDRNEFAAATRAAAAVASDTSRGVQIACSKSDVTLRCKSSEYGSSTVTCPVFDSDGASEFCVNPWYIVGWLSALPAESDNHVEISMCDGNVVMRCGEYSTVVMPMSVI
jgi:DNA polymerase III sliding clamp (beta) subunit (PCNA family)